jgi:hypothetical protein
VWSSLEQSIPFRSRSLQPSLPDQVIDSSSFPVEEGSWFSFALLGGSSWFPSVSFAPFVPDTTETDPSGSFLPRARVCTSGVRSLVSWEPEPEEDDEDGSRAAA